MPNTAPPEKIKDAFDLYLKYNGERFDLIEKEMRLKGWIGFNKNCLRNRGLGKNFREGWIERFQWRKALEIHIAAQNKTILTGGEKLLHEVETIREKLFEQIQTSGVNNRDLIWQHRDYSLRSAEILEQIEKARSVTHDFADFLRWMITISISISPGLARELCNAEEAIIRRAKDEFGNKNK